MNVYLQEEIVFDSKEEAVNFISGLPSFALVQFNVVKLASSCVYQVLIYCFDDEVKLCDYL